MVSPFKIAVEFVLEREGGYTWDSRDPGGETNFGICARAYPNISIKALTRGEAVAIYFRDYWSPAKCEALPAPLAVLHFDTAVNQGVVAANRILQASAGVDADGNVGPKTIAAVTAKGARSMLEEYAARRMNRYGVTANFDRFGLGWSRRLMSCLSLCNSLKEV